MHDDFDKVQLILTTMACPEVKLSPQFFRGFVCTKKCGACCTGNINLVFFEGARWDRFKYFYPKKVKDFKEEMRKSYYDGREVKIFCNPQKSNSSHHCVYLSKKTAKCLIHMSHPIIGTLLGNLTFRTKRKVKSSRGYKEGWFEEQIKDNIGYLRKQVFGRGWAMTKIDGEKGALCKFKHPISIKELVTIDIPLLEELYELGELLGFPTVLQNAIDRLKLISRRANFFGGVQIPSHYVTFIKE